MAIYRSAVFEAVAATHLHSIIRLKHRVRVSCVPKKKSGSRLGCPTIFRQRVTVNDIHRRMGDIYFRRAFRMSFLTFQAFFNTIKSDLRKVMKRTGWTHCTNGIIPYATRVAVTLRYFAGGDPYDLAPLWGISNTEVFNSVDDVTDAINSCKDLKLEYPDDHHVQKSITDGFKSKSVPGFDCCAGAIDGMLIWTHAPNLSDCDDLGVGQKKFFCGRKHKFGLNFQAVCDHESRFLDISILYGAACSDLLAFENSSLKAKLERAGFLADGLCIFGDNAYMNRFYMATPFPNVSGHGIQQDSYNFYHSQLRIRIECAFGILVQRFGYLRKKAPQQHTMTKVMAIVASMCRIHNWLIDERVGPVTANSIPSHTDEDALSMTLNGAVPLEIRPGHSRRDRLPNQLLDAGNHFADDPDRSIRRARAHPRPPTNISGLRDSNKYDSSLLPRDNLCMKVSNLCLRRPVANRRVINYT